MDFRTQSSLHGYELYELVDYQALIAISSHRDFTKCTPEIAHNQIRALRSWIGVFERVLYLGEYCSELSTILTEFVPAEDRPSIKAMCKLAASMGTWTALINADIVVAPKMKRLECVMEMKNVECAVSGRFDLSTGFKIDEGLDFFVATPKVWSQVAARIPADFRISYGQWDNWMLNYFSTNYGKRCADLTPSRLIFHPKHGSRLGQNWESPALKDKYTTAHSWPSTSIYA